jgi:hypothetical protein
VDRAVEEHAGYHQHALIAVFDPHFDVSGRVASQVNKAAAPRNLALAVGCLDRCAEADDSAAASKLLWRRSGMAARFSGSVQCATSRCTTGGETVSLRQRRDGMHKKQQVPAAWSRRRTRVEPPDVDEAVVAARGLTEDVNSQIELAAQFIGLSEEEIRPAVLNAAAQSLNQHRASTPARRIARSFVIEKRAPRARFAR